MWSHVPEGVAWGQLPLIGSEVPSRNRAKILNFPKKQMLSNAYEGK